MKINFVKLVILLLVSINSSYAAVQQKKANISPIPQQEQIIEKGFVAFATPDFFPYIEILLESIKAFSKYPIVVFGINSDIPFSTEKYPFLIKRRWNLKSLDRDSIMFCKPDIILASQIKNGIYVDADMIVNDGVDNLFENHSKITTYPLCPKFVFDPNNQKKVMNAMGVTEKTMPYVQAQLIFSEKCKPFLIEWKKSCMQFRKESRVAEHDETVLNVLLWKYKATQFVKCWEPWYPTAYDYINDSLEFHNNSCYKDFIGDIDYYMFHGCKNINESKKILNLLIQKKFSQHK